MGVNLCLRLPHHDCNVFHCVAQFLGRSVVSCIVSDRVDLVLAVDRACDILTALNFLALMVCEVTRLICLKIDNWIILGGLGAGDSQLALANLWVFLDTSAAHDVSISEFDIWSLLAPTSTLAAATTPIIFIPFRSSVDNLWLAVCVIGICEENIAVTLNLQIYLVNVLN